MFMELSHDQARRHLKSFDIPDRVIINYAIFSAIHIEYNLIFGGSNWYTLPHYMRRHGLRWKKLWTCCIHLHILVIANTHHFAVEIIFAESTMYMYNSNCSCTTQSQFKLILEPMAIVVPIAARTTDICSV